MDIQQDWIMKDLPQEAPIVNLPSSLSLFNLSELIISPLRWIGGKVSKHLGGQ